MSKEQNSMAIVKTGQNPLLKGPTVDTISITREERARANKIEMYQHRAEVEAAAQEVAAACKQIKVVEGEAKVLHRKFHTLVKEMRPAFEKVRKGFAHLEKGQKIMGESTGEAWAHRYLGGYTYDWLCRLLSRAKSGDLLMTEGVKVLAPKAKKQKKLPELPAGDWSDEAYINACVGYLDDLLKPIAEDPERWERIMVEVSTRISSRLAAV